MKSALEVFATKEKFSGKGPLCVVLVVTDIAKRKSFPLMDQDFVAESGGQVAGLGKSAVQAILKRYGIDRVLAEEGGRTSRGSIKKMKAYVAFLNSAHRKKILDLDVAEAFWVERVRAFFAGKPFTLRVDAHLGIRAVVRRLMSQAQSRQADAGGTMILGSVMQHLVGAKLDVVLDSRAKIQHHGSNDSDQKVDRTGDFDIGDVSIHVTNAPSEALLRKCKANIEAGRRPLIITSTKGAVVAEGLADNLGIADSVDIIEFEQFIATNVYELTLFKSEQRRLKIGSIIEKYNEIVRLHETDPSLLIEIATGKY